jgi:hypothetical protein
MIKLKITRKNPRKIRRVRKRWRERGGGEREGEEGERGKRKRTRLFWFLEQYKACMIEYSKSTIICSVAPNNASSSRVDNYNRWRVILSYTFWTTIT